MDWDIRIIDENVEPIVFEGDADLVGITAMTSNANRAYQISEKYRQKGVKTVMGGIHASFLPNEAVRYVDSVVIGEAESVWSGLLRDFENNRLQPFYRGERTSLVNLPKPMNNLYGHKYRIAASVQTSRGCPMDCEFCSVTAFNGRTYRQRPVAEVLDEIEGLDNREFSFSDDNILSYGKKAEDRAIALFKGMVDRDLNKRWASQVGVEFGSNSEVLKWAKKSGCIAVFIGFESSSEESLKQMQKVSNLKFGVTKYKEAIDRIHDHGIGVHGAFICGSDGDKKDVFERTANFIIDSKIDSSTITMLTPLPGTRLYERMKSDGRLLRTNYPQDWRHYDTAEAVFILKNMTPNELEQGVYQIYKQITSRKTSLKRALNSFMQTKNLTMTAITYSINRGLNSFVDNKYQWVTKERSLSVESCQPSHPVEEREVPGEVGSGIAPAIGVGTLVYPLSPVR